MGLYVNTAIVDGDRREDLLLALQSIMSDDDTNGSNGIEYLWGAAREWFKYDPDIDYERTLSDEEEMRFTNDNYLFEKIMSLPSDTSDETIIDIYYDYYSGSVRDYFLETTYEIIYDDDNKVKVIIFAYSSK